MLVLVELIAVFFNIFFVLLFLNVEIKMHWLFNVSIDRCFRFPGIFCFKTVAEAFVV